MVQDNWDWAGDRKCPICGKYRIPQNSRRRCCSFCLSEYVGPDKFNEDGTPHEDAYAVIYRKPLGEKTVQLVKAHTWVMEQKLGRKLVYPEQVHHKNGNRMDFRPENLELKDSAHGRGQLVRDIAVDYLKRSGAAFMGDLATVAVDRYLAETLGTDLSIMALGADAYEELPTAKASCHLHVIPFFRLPTSEGRTRPFPGMAFDAVFTIKNGLEVYVDGRQAGP